MSKTDFNDTLILGIKKLREKKGYTQNELAEKIGLSESYVIKWENNQTEISFKNLMKICDECNCSLDFLFGRTDYINEKEEIEKLKGEIATDKDFRKIFDIKLSNSNIDEEDKYSLFEMNVNKYFLEYYIELTELKEKLEKSSITESEYNFEKEKLDKQYSSVLANSNTMIKYFCHKMTIEKEKQN